MFGAPGVPPQLFKINSIVKDRIRVRARSKSSSPTSLPCGPWDDDVNAMTATQTLDGTAKAAINNLENGLGSAKAATQNHDNVCIAFIG